MPLNHIMIDLETMGTRYDAPILSIGAVRFDPSTGEIAAAHDRFYAGITPKSALEAGRLDGDTLKWWMAQSDAARAAAMAGDRHIVYALHDLEQYVSLTGDAKDTRVWGNGATFDITILEYAYHQHEMRPGWVFRGIRDCRTIAELAAGLYPDMPRPTGNVSHNALDDAVYQAQWVSAAWQALRPAA